mgnify:CR=1 FL=1
MPKLKTKSSAKKRFKISARGKVIMARAMITFPLADILNLFFAELLVFNFGIIERGYTYKEINLQPILRLIKAGLP